MAEGALLWADEKEGRYFTRIEKMIASAITQNVLHHVDALIDFHSGGSGGRLQARVDQISPLIAA